VDLDNRRIVQSLKRGLEILEIVAKHSSQGGTSLAEISNEIRLNKNTVFQLLSTLLFTGFVELHPKGRRYFIGFNAIHVAEIGDYQAEMASIWQPLLAELTREVNETSHIAIISQGKVRFIAKQEATVSFRVQTNLVELMPIHCSAVGKALIAFLDTAERDFVIDKYLDYRPLTKKTITQRAILINDLEKSRERGFAIDNEESFDGVLCVAAPIYNIRRTVVASIGISTPTVRVKDIQFLGEIIIKYANQASNIISPSA
jgi:DNA-binding IclR family transcriptional regulator